MRISIFRNDGVTRKIETLGKSTRRKTGNMKNKKWRRTRVFYLLRVRLKNGTNDTIPIKVVCMKRRKQRYEEINVNNILGTLRPYSPTILENVLCLILLTLL